MQAAAASAGCGLAGGYRSGRAELARLRGQHGRLRPGADVGRADGRTVCVVRAGKVAGSAPPTMPCPL